MQGNQNRLCRPLMRSNCCCDSHSHSREAQYLLRHEHKHLVRRCCCHYETSQGLRGRRLEVEGWGGGIIDTQNMQIRCPYENARPAFSDSSTLGPGFKKGSMWTIGQNDAQHVHLHKRAFPCGRPLNEGWDGRRPWSDPRALTTHIIMFHLTVECLFCNIVFLSFLLLLDLSKHFVNSVFKGDI